MNYFLKLTPLIVLFLIAFCQKVRCETVTISTELGQIRGQILLSSHGKKFYAFRGIRYAKSRRFQDPVPAGPWSNSLIYDATKDGSNCIQVDEMAVFTKTFKVVGSDDCLFLNIYRPQKSEFDKFPVIFFIHGGGYMSGSASSTFYGPQRLMDKNVVFVTINYRLGPFGFLSTSDKAAPGNYGLLDQVLALRWVHDHISDFGGDPNSVTIFGGSAGASSVGLHMLSPLSKGLFHAAIMQSGNALIDWGFEYRTPKIATLELAQKLNCSTTSTRTTMDCLKSKNAEAILKSTNPLPGTIKEPKPMFTFQPTTDKVRGTKAFLPKHPKQLLLNGDISIVPTISGITKDEGIVFYLWPAVERGGIAINDTVTDMLSISAPGLMHDPNRGHRAIKIIEALYLSDEDKNNLTKKVMTMNKILGGVMDTPTDNTHELLAQRGCTVYSYKFSFRVKNSWLKQLAPLLNVSESFISDLNMVAHGDDIKYLFHSMFFPDDALDADDKKMAEMLLTLWTNFAKNKKPTLNENDPINFRWSTFKANRPEYLDLDEKPKMVKGYLSEDRSLWNAIYQYHESFHDTEDL